MTDDIFEILICDEQGEVLLHGRLDKEEAEDAIRRHGLEEDKPHMTLARAVLAEGRYPVGGKVLFVKRVPATGDVKEQ